MAKKPPRRNRRVNGDISVDLKHFLTRLARALCWEGDAAVLGQPGSYSADRACNTPGRFAVDYLFSEIMSKFDDCRKDTDQVKTQEALKKFHQAEVSCTSTNEWFDREAWAACSGTPRDCDPDVWQAMLLAKRKIESWVGPFDWNEVAAGSRFTYGASARMPRTRSTPAHKYSGKLEITASVEPLVQAALQFDPAWGSQFQGGEVPFSPLEGNRVLCVPKNYKQHRIIAAEPSGNLYFQKGVGLALRRRLKAVGVDLHSQAMNQDFAFLGSVTGLVATVDLSMASDTVSKGIVEWAMPPDWVAGMSLIRSPKGVLPDGSKVLYRKWSSMGNAYTFELESLLFLGLARAATVLSGSDERFVTVYGDDIIVPSGACDLFLRVLRRCGFVPNEKKTFVSGPFRESCGKHFFSGKDVSPFYIRSQPRTLTELFLLVNNLERWIRRVGDCLPDSQVEAVKALIKQTRSYAPSEWRRPRIPDGYGDGAFIGTFDECLPRRPRGKWLWWEGWQVEVISSSPRRIVEADESSYLTLPGVTRAMLETLELGPPSSDDSWLESLIGAETTSGAVLPDRSKRYRTTTLIVAQF